MEKIFKISILCSALILSSFIGNYNLASAEVFMPITETAYTIDDLLAFDAELTKELEEACGVKTACLQKTYNSKIQEDERYSILHDFLSTPFMISSANPSQNTIKVFFHKRNAYDKWAKNPTDSIIQELKMGWRDAGSSLDGNYLSSSGENLPEDAHIIYNADLTNHEAGWIPGDTEFGIEVSGPSLTLNTDGFFQYTFTSSRSSSGGNLNFASCINSPYYKLGDECKVVYTKLLGQTYIPYRNNLPVSPNYLKYDASKEVGKGSLISENKTSGIVISGKNSDDENSSNIVAKEELVKEQDTKAGLTTESDGGPAVESSSFAETNEVKDSDFAVPLGGEETTNSCYADFPWWFIVFVLACDVIVMWLFWPKNQKKS